ncbi:hypothetical protein STEG23_017191 [Scotinomys teguina]
MEEITSRNARSNTCEVSPTGQLERELNKDKNRPTYMDRGEAHEASVLHKDKNRPTNVDRGKAHVTSVLHKDKNRPTNVDRGKAHEASVLHKDKNRPTNVDRGKAHEASVLHKDKNRPTNVDRGKAHEASVLHKELEAQDVEGAGQSEGFHSYHHAFPYDYSASEYRWHISFTTFFIDCMAALGLAYDRKRVSKAAVLARIKRSGHGS